MSGDRETYAQLKAAAKRAMGAESWKGFLEQPQADAGWPGFTYYKDTVRFFERHKYAIFNLLADEAEGMGESIATMIAGFRTDFTDYDTFANLMSWFTIEAIAHREGGE